MTGGKGGERGGGGIVRTGAIVRAVRLPGGLVATQTRTQEARAAALAGRTRRTRR